MSNGVVALPETEIRVQDDNEAGWGKILIGVRLEKMVEAAFFRVWTELLNKGIRLGDGYVIAEGMIPHRAANYLVREFLKSDSDYDSLFLLDSDCDIDKDFLNRFRDYDGGWDYDILQAFYTRRGWPPDAIWIARTEYGDLKKCIVLHPDHTQDVALVGLHSVLIRRHVLENMLGDNDPETFDWFFYPRNKQQTEDAAFSFEAEKLGFRLGATTHVKAGHISHVSIGWETYQDWLYTSGTMERIKVYQYLLEQVSSFTGEEDGAIIAKAGKGSKNVSEVWEKERPRDPDEIRHFYGKDDSGYIYDLFNWNTSEPYMRIVMGLQDFIDNEALVIGAGLGIEIDFLLQNNDVTFFELPGLLADFLWYKFGDTVPSLPGYKLDDLKSFSDQEEKFSLIVAVDVVEHVHPKEIDEFLETLDWLLAPGGTLFLHNNFSDQDIYPMHFDHSDVFDEWCKDKGLILETSLTWRKPTEEQK